MSDKLTEAARSGKAIKCSTCEGHGVVMSWDQPDECRDCAGSGQNWQYPNGRIAIYYSGPFIGRAALASTSSRMMDR